MMKKTIISCILLIIFICGCALLEKSEKSITLRYKFKEGEEVKYNVSTISKGTITMSGLPIETISISPICMEQKAEFVVTQKVIETEGDEIANVEISCDSFKQEIKIGKEKEQFPIFGKKEENLLLNFLEGKKFNIKIASNGDLLEIKGIEEVFNQILSQMSEKVPNEFIHKFKEEFKKRMTMSISESYQRFPMEEVKVGDIWIQEIEDEIPFVGHTRGKFTYTLEGFKQVKGLECAQIGIEATLNFNEKGFEALSQLNIPSFEVKKFKGNGQGKGKMIFAYQEGKLINTDLRINMNMEIDYMGKAGEGKEPITMKMDFDTQTVVKLQ